jgi:ABC-type molybdenum transport system ATPase subunit/photorepair protein PhrA
MAPRVLILDEPTTGLDYPQQRAMLELLARLRAAARRSSSSPTALGGRRVRGARAL